MTGSLTSSLLRIVLCGNLISVVPHQIAESEENLG